jgi:hypothetical protein
MPTVNLMKRRKEPALNLSAIRQSILMVFLLTAHVACVDHEVEIPSDVIGHQQMVDILVDIHVVEGARSGTLILGDTNSIPDYYARIYLKHGTTEQDFKTSFDWYTQHPEKLKLVYEDVIVALSKLEEEVKAKSDTATSYQID